MVKKTKDFGQDKYLKKGIKWRKDSMLSQITKVIY